MKKTKYSCLIFFLIAGLSPEALSQSTDQLFKEVFGKPSTEEKKVTVDATLDDFFIGEVEVHLVGERIVLISIEDLKKVLQDKVREARWVSYQLGTGLVDPEKLPFKVVYHAAELRLSVVLPPEDLRPVDANVYDDLIPYYSRKASMPSPFSLGLNYRLEQSFNKHTQQEDAFLVQTDSFMNIKKVTFENQMNYDSNREKPWVRQNSRAIYDLPNRMQRLEAGDVNYPIIGYQQATSLGGLSFYRDFSLNPYRVVTPRSSFEYQLSGRSLVKTYVNNVLLKTEYMNAGRYAVQDIPLNNGLNRIIVEITDEFGVVRVVTFNDSSSLDLLAQEMSRYSIAVGYPVDERESGRYYQDERGVFFTGFYQYGFTKHWTGGAYGQGNKDFSLLGTNHILSSGVGNWALDGAYSRNDVESGQVGQLTYQLNLFGAYWYDSHTLTAKLEYRSPHFSERGGLFTNRFDTTGTVSYSVPLWERFNVTAGGVYQHPTLAPAPRMSFNTSVTTKIFESSSLTLYAARSRDEFRAWSSQMYLFFNMTFGESSTFVSAFYERESQTKRLTAIRDTGNTYNDLKMVANVDTDRTSRSGSLDLRYNTALADVGARQEVLKTKGAEEQGYRTSLRVLGSLAFVHNGDDFGFSIGRPISNSFVIFKPHGEWKGQRFGVQNSNGSSDTGTGLFGESMVSGLIPYQYRRLQLDPSNLEPGYILGQESFVVYPRKNSGHLFVVGQSGFLVLKGRLMGEDKRPIGLKVGFWTSLANGKTVPFFTDREGAFFIEGVEPHGGTIQIDDSAFKPKPLDFSGYKQGMVEVGEIILPRGENNL